MCRGRLGASFLANRLPLHRPLRARPGELQTSFWKKKNELDESIAEEAILKAALARAIPVPTRTRTTRARIPHPALPRAIPGGIGGGEGKGAKGTHRLHPHLRRLHHLPRTLPRDQARRAPTVARRLDHVVIAKGVPPKTTRNVVRLRSEMYSTITPNEGALEQSLRAFHDLGFSFFSL